MRSWEDTRKGMDQEEKASEALGALECLHDLLVYQERDAMVRVEPLTYLIKVLYYSVHDAIPDGKPKHRAPVND